MKTKLNFALNIGAIIVCCGLCVVLRCREYVKKKSFEDRLNEEK